MSPVTTWVQFDPHALMLRLDGRDVTVAFRDTDWDDLDVVRCIGIGDLWSLAEECVAELEARTGRQVAAGSVLALGGE